MTDEHVGRTPDEIAAVLHAGVPAADKAFVIAARTLSELGELDR
ncbi:hypothetical protein ACFS2C_06545 [Prauserella oleivorans]|uniref:Carboxymuconolactone decarboxylase family protein n=1 Tax=Prauserella oleivorans TaxID=1478153 RepID=A0ABW5W9V2_9PSEU